MSKAKQKELVKKRLKEKQKLMKAQKRQHEEKLAEQKFKKEGIKDLSLLAVGRPLKKKEHIIAQAGALGINREYLRQTPQKMRMALQPYSGKQIEITGVITDVKFTDFGKISGFMIATPFISVNSKRLNIDSHLWLFFQKMQYTEGADNQFKLALGTYIQIEAIIGSYRSHGQTKYGINEWVISNTGIGYIYPEKNGSITEVNLINSESRLENPFATVTNKDNKYKILSISKDEYEEGEKHLLEVYAKMRKDMDAMTASGLRKSLKN